MGPNQTGNEMAIKIGPFSWVSNGYNKVVYNSDPVLE
jgi:hypothetical protein